MKRVAIIQARMSSSRLRGKVLEPLLGIPMIVFMLRRVERASHLDHILVATSIDKSDDMLAEVVRQNGFDCFRGSLEDVLSRYAAAADRNKADVIVRLTGDCPLVDPDLIDKCLTTLADGMYDYVSNIDPPSFPNGLDVEAFTGAALHSANSEAQLPADREHVTSFIRRNKAVFRGANFRSCVDLSHLRWTVDHADDLDFVRYLLQSVRGRELVHADRFDFLRAQEQHIGVLPKNVHSRYESYTDDGIEALTAEKRKEKF